MGPLIFLHSKKELSKISRTTRRKIMKIFENLKEGNSNHRQRFHSERANISARYNDWKLDRTSLLASFSNSVSYHMCARIFCGSPVCRKTFLISMPDTNPSLSESVCLNNALNLSLSPELTTHGMASMAGACWLTCGWKF